MRRAKEIAEGWKEKKAYQRQAEKARIDLDNRKLRARLASLDPGGRLGLLDPQWKKQERRVRKNARSQAAHEHERRE